MTSASQRLTFFPTRLSCLSQAGPRFAASQYPLLTDSSLLLLLIFASYVPQISLILNHRSVSGITQSYMMFNYLFTATQFTMALLYSYHVIGYIKDQKLNGLAAYGASLGLIQMTILWIGSISLYDVSS